MNYWINGKSARAVEAENDGQVILTTITKKWLSENNVELSLKDAKYLMREGKCRYESKHHTGKYFNWTYFYVAQNFYDAIEKYGSVAAITTERENFEKAEKEKLTKEVVVDCVLEEWEVFYDGPYGRKRCVLKEKKFPAVLKGKWLYKSDGSKMSINKSRLSYTVREQAA